MSIVKLNPNDEKLDQPTNKVNFLKLLPLMFLLLFVGCQKDDLHKIDGSESFIDNKDDIEVKTVSQDEISPDFPAFFKTSQSTTASNQQGKGGSSSGYVLADLGRLIHLKDARYYTFPVLNTPAEGYFENVVFSYIDATRRIFLVQYDFTKREIEQLKNSEPLSFRLQDKIVQVSELSDGEYSFSARNPCTIVFEEFTWCSYGNHPHGYYPGGADCPGHSSLITGHHLDCGGGGGSTGGGPVGGGSPGGGGDGDNDGGTDPGPQELSSAPGFATTPTFPSTFAIFLGMLPPNLLTWLESHPTERARVKNFLETNEYSMPNMAFSEEAIGVLMENSELSFDYLRYNKNPYTDANTTGDVNNNPVGGYDVFQYPDFNTTQQQWPTISNVISTSDFIGWRHPGIDENCMDYAKAQIAVNGYQISSYFNNNGQTIQIYTAQNGADAQAVEDAISYLIYALESGIPVIVGVDAHSGSPNPQTDNTTDHFVVIVGMGSDSNGKYFTFYDNASGAEPFTSYGASPNNKLYYNSTSHIIKGSSETPYCDGDGMYGYYIITHIRKSKSL